MTRAFQKVSTNAADQLASIAELHFADQAQSDTVTFILGKLTEFAHMYKEQITGDVQKKWAYFPFSN